MNETYKTRWNRLHRYARMTRDINPALIGSVLTGQIRPHKWIDGFVLANLLKKQKGFPC